MFKPHWWGENSADEHRPEDSDERDSSSGEDVPLPIDAVTGKVCNGHLKSK